MPEAVKLLVFRWKIPTFNVYNDVKPMQADNLISYMHKLIFSFIHIYRDSVCVNSV